MWPSKVCSNVVIYAVTLAAAVSSGFATTATGASWATAIGAAGVAAAAAGVVLAVSAAAVSPFVKAEVSVVVSLGRGTSAAVDLVSLFFLGAARLALRSRPPMPPSFFFSLSVNSSPEVPSAFFSFLVPKLLKKDVRRLSEGEVAVVVAAAASVTGLVSVVAGAAVGAAVSVVVGTGSSCGAVSETTVPSSLVFSAGLVALSFLPKREPKTDARLLVLSLVVDVGVTVVDPAAESSFFFSAKDD